MSLINQMLKDLEKRSGLNTSSTFEPAENLEAANTASASLGAIPIEDADVKVEKKGPSTFLIISIIFLVLYLTLYFWFTVYNVQPIPRDNFPIAKNTAPITNLQRPQPQVVDSDAVIADITAAIEEKILDEQGQVDSTHIREMVANARRKNESAMQNVSPEVAAISEYDTLNKMHLEAELAEQTTAPTHPTKPAKKIATTPVEQTVERTVAKAVSKPVEDAVDVEIVTTKPATLTPSTPDVMVAAKETAPKVAKPSNVARVAKVTPNKPQIAKPTVAAKTTVVTRPAVIAHNIANAAVRPKPPAPTLPAPTISKPSRPKLASVTSNAKSKMAMQHPQSSEAKFIKHVRPQQASEQLYQKALDYVQQGRVSEAQNILAKAIKTDPKNHDARQTLAALLLDNNRIADASTVLKDGLTTSPEHVAFRMAAARLEVELGQQPEALRTLLSGVSFAHNNGKYHAFLATLLQRNEQHKAAAEHYQTALNIDRGLSNAYVGLGVSLQALGKLEAARTAYSSAKQNHQLDGKVKSFIDYRLKEVETRISSR